MNNGLLQQYGGNLHILNNILSKMILGNSTYQCPKDPNRYACIDYGYTTTKVSLRHYKEGGSLWHKAMTHKNFVSEF